MAQFTVDSKVYIPATVTSVTENLDGIFYEVKLRAINKSTTLSVEESDIVARETNITPTDDQSNSEQQGSDTTSEP